MPRADAHIISGPGAVYYHAVKKSILRSQCICYRNAETFVISLQAAASATRRRIEIARAGERQMPRPYYISRAERASARY